MKQSRRNFLKNSALASAGLFVPYFLKAITSKNVHFLNEGSDNKKLVIIQLSGGNDGLNTIIPYRNDIYYSMRPTLAVPASSVLQLNDELGLNPVMKSLTDLYNNGEFCIINNVGYPNPDRSHFRSMDIWQTASSSNEYLTTGWIGRYLDSDCSRCSNPHSAIELNDSLSLALKGENLNGIAFNNEKTLTLMRKSKKMITSDSVGETSNSNLNYLYKTIVQTSNSAEYIYQKSKIYSTKADYPQNQFAKDLKLIAELIISDIDTSVFYVSLSGFDTHFGQKGKQERLLKTYSDAVASFTHDLKTNGKFEDTVIMTFSEFGRRVKQNGSAGTDHGTANNLFIIGGKLNKPGVYNQSADLQSLDEGDLIYRIDFRSVYSTLLSNWLNVDDKRILGDQFDKLNFI